jgi:group I intron endonuclease
MKFERTITNYNRPKSSGIYKIQSKANGRVYIGSATNIGARVFNGHLKELSEGRHGNRHLQRHYNKYGGKDLLLSVLEFCPREKLIEREQYWIDTLHPKFNICKTAGSSIGVKHTKDFGRRVSATRKILFTTKEGEVLRDKMREVRELFFQSKQGILWKKKQGELISKLGTSKRADVKQKMSMGHKRFYTTGEGEREKVERKKRQSELWKDPAYAQKNIEGRKLFWASEKGQLRKKELMAEKKGNFFFSKNIKNADNGKQ